MLNADSQQITLLLINWSNGDEVALEKLMPLVYGAVLKLSPETVKRD